MIDRPKSFLVWLTQDEKRLLELLSEDESLSSYFRNLIKQLGRKDNLWPIKNANN